MGFQVNVLDRAGEEQGSVLSVRIEEEDAPLVIDDEGHEVRDYGNVDWPSDDEIAAEASKLLERPIRVKFSDRGDDLLEGIYRVV